MAFKRRFAVRSLKMLHFVADNCVVVCRSSSADDYCPSHQVDFIQASVVRMLETVYGDLDVKLNYAQS